MTKRGALGFLSVTVAVVSVLFASTPLNAQRTTNRAELLRLSEQFRRDVERRRTPLYYELLQSTQPAVRALNLNPDVELMYIGDNGVPVYYVVDNINAAGTISTDEVWPGGGGGYSLTGSGTQGYQLAIWDGGGVLLSHQEFGGRVNQADSPSGTSSHSTHVAGTMIAAGVDPGAQGMSYEANLDAYEWSFDESEMAAAAAAGLQVSNHSYGPATGWTWDSGKGEWYWYGNITVSTVEDYTFGFYNSESADWDEIAYNAPDYLICQSAGNDRNDFGPGPGGGHWVWDSGWVWSTDTRDPDGGADEYDCIGARKGAKNILTVGAVNDIPSGYTQPSDVVQTSFSSWGPMDDGRIKPDIVANGASLYSCSNTGDDSYSVKSGTSMSSPNAAGSINLLVRHYQATLLSSPRAATMKAIVVHTADEAGPNDGPDYQAGWGLMNTEKAADLIQAGGGIAEKTLLEGLTHVFTFTVDTVKDVRVTIAWTDIPGNPLPPSLNPRNPRLVNDLDVRVERIQSATIYEPWVLDVENPDSAATQGDNVVDNVEQIYIADAETGDYEIRVSHKGSLIHGSPWNTDQQEYSIVCSEDITYVPSFRHYVSVSGSNQSPYDTPALAAHTVEDAILVAEAGDTVLVESDTFTGVSLNLVRGIVLSGAWDVSFTSRDLETGKTVLDLNSNIRVQTGAVPFVIDGFVVQNGQSTYGGGIEILNSEVTIQNCKIEQNEAYDTSVGSGGGVYGFESTVHVIDSEILSNTAVQGGGIYLDDCTGSISNTVISDNSLLFGTGTSTGGGVGIVNSTGIAFSGNTISNNTANVEFGSDLKGGGVYLLDSSGISMNGDVIAGNEAGIVGSSGSGGGIRVEDSDIDMTGVTISQNEAKTFGGGLLADGTSIVALRESKVMWNSALLGGGVYLTGSESSVDHSLFIGNSGTGCSILNTTLGSFIGNTLDRNSGSPGGGAFFSNTSVPVFNNIIVNSVGAGILCGGTTKPTPAYNNVWNSSGLDYDGCTPGVGAISADPLFSDTALVDYHLTIHSPAIDAGDPNPTYNDPDGSRGDMGWYGSHVFTMDQPEYPKNATVSFDSVYAVLSWDPNPELDVVYYAIYKDTVVDFVPSVDNFVQLVAAPDTSYNDGQPDSIAYFKLCAIDTAGYAGGYSGSAEGDPTGIGDAVASVRDFRLSQNYPNPFNPTTTFQFTLDTPAFVRLDVFNVAGQRVATVFAKEMPAGTHRHTWMAREQASGVYFYRLKAGSRTVNKRMVLLK
ncbi:MAG: S8 family serine peptidase [Candidatus Latescibacterota bacterium]|nr:MAG: S8 family serine peptidase [Candidatus Latescibacterota bacterium]